MCAGLGAEAEEEHPREGGHLDLGGRECLACSISSTTTGGTPSDAGRDKEGGKGGRKQKRPAGAAAFAAASRRGRSELYLVLDAKAFLLATPDR